MYANIMRLVQEPKAVQRDVRGEQTSVINTRVAISLGNEKSVFIDIAVWGSLAELIEKYLHKGDEFYGEGELRNGTWTLSPEQMADGKEKTVHTVYLQLNHVKFTHGKKTVENGK